MEFIPVILDVIIILVVLKYCGCNASKKATHLDIRQDGEIIDFEDKEKK